MDKSVKWQDNLQPNNVDSSDSPTLSDRKPAAPLKRKKSNIFTKIRKSIIGLTSSDNNTNIEPAVEDDKRSLKRALSMDAGLQNRISQLASTVTETTANDNQQDLNRTPSKNRIRRSKSLMTTITDFIEQPTTTGTGSTMQSPKIPDSSTVNDTNDSIIEACESFNTPKTLSFLNTIETTHLSLTHQIFNCTWLAPTRKSQLFPGTLSLLPKSSTIQFHCQHFNRTIRLKFLFDDILNISRGTWNDKRNQALIIDLIRGKRKTWVFVAWTDDHFQQATDCLVQAWRLHCLNQIKSRLDRRKAHLNMKYCRIIKEADKAHEASKQDINTVYTMFSSIFNYLTASESKDTSDIIELKFQNYPSISYKNVLYESEIPFITPQVLSSILAEQSTNFMTNFRALNGIEITNDSGWNYKNLTRTFVSFVTKEDSNKKTFKWRVKQEIKVNEPEFVLFQAILQVTDSQIFKINYEIKNKPENYENFTSDYSCFIKITGEMESSANNNSEEEICSYFRKNYFPPLFNLLEALINESESEFEAEAENIENYKFLLPPHYRFVKETIRTRLLKVNLYFTTVFLPFLYKLLYFKEFKHLRYLLISFVFIYLLRISLKQTVSFIKISRTVLLMLKSSLKVYLKT